MKEKKNLQWATRFGFIMTAAGAAIGLGNLQRFPQLVATHGGGAFLVLYLLCVIFFGWPLMLAEISLGRSLKSDPITTFFKASKNKLPWKYLGFVGISIAFFILSYYTVSCAWTLSFMFKSILSDNTNLSFNSIISQPKTTFPFFIIFFSIVTYIVSRGLNAGVEKFSKIVMPTLFIIQIILIIKIFSIEGSLSAFLYYLKPDFTKLRYDSLLHALSQAFFSLCIGEAVLLTYGSYAKKSENLPLSAGFIALTDTSVAFLAGLIIIPSVIITNQDPNQGVSLVYNTLFTIFQNMKNGNIFLILYFIILAIAGLTTCIALLDVCTNVFRSFFEFSKIHSTIIVSICSFLVGIPSLLSKGGSVFFSKMHFLGIVGFYEIMDFFWGSIGMVISGLLTTIFVGWVWGVDNAQKELENNSIKFKVISKLWSLHIKWTAPLIIIYILKDLLFYQY